MLFESYQEAAALTALDAPQIATRIAVSVKPEADIYRMIVDTAELDVGGMMFSPVPFLKISNITSGEGAGADTGTITLDGREMLSPPSTSTEQVLQNILTYPLRDRPIQIGLIVLNIETKQAIGLIPQFVGIIDRAVLERSRGEASVLTINIASYRAYAQRRVQRLYSHTDHSARHPGDSFLKQLSDTVFRSGKYAWNSTQATGSGASRSGGGRGLPAGPTPGFHMF